MVLRSKTIWCFFIGLFAHLCKECILKFCNRSTPELVESRSHRNFSRRRRDKHLLNFINVSFYAFWRMI